MTTPLDREGWSYQPCQYKCGRQAQLTIDMTPKARSGKYGRYCWQCYWGHDCWKLGPIVNCGPAWDVVDVRRESRE